jgi:HEAT repeat protein
MSLSRASRAVPALLTAALFALPTFAAEPTAPNPVQDLRAALLQPPGPDGLEARKKNLKRRLDALGSPGELAAALALDVWPESSGQHETPSAADADSEIRTLLLKQFGEQIRKALSAEDSGTRAAAATLLGTTATAERAERARRSLGQFNPVRFGRPGGDQEPTAPADPFVDLAPDLVKHMKEDKDAPVRRAAVRALVEVRPDLQLTMDALGDLLGGGEKDPSVRRSAAAALGALLAGADEEQHSLDLTPDPVVRLLKLAKLAAPLAAERLAKDDDQEVRLQCLKVLRRVVLGWQGLIANGAGRAPDVVALPEAPAVPVSPLFAEIQKLLQSLAGALNKALPSVTGALAEDKPEIAVGAAEVLETAADIRRLVLKDSRADPLPALPDARDALAKNLSAKEVRVRLAAVYVLETLGAEASPASAVLAKALREDADPFVRWGAARALGKMAPDQLDAVPALAKALEDKDDDVRQTAPIALARFGPAAKPAVAALAAAVKRDDGLRLSALKALAAVGAAAAPAADAAAAALADPDAEVRVAAADALARMGSLKDGPVTALRKALDDPDPGVRRAVSGALLRGPGK